MKATFAVAAAALVIASIIVSSLVAFESDASIASALTRPVRKIYQKAKNQRGRVKYSRQKASGVNIRTRSAAPTSVAINSTDFNNTNTNGSGNGNGNGNDNNADTDFESKCLIQRGPNFTKQTTLHFFNYQSHSDKATRVCGTNVEIKLNIINGSTADNPQLDTSQLKATLIDSNLFDPRLETYFITHGFQANWNGDEWLCKLKDLVLDNSDANVFIVNWSGGSKPELSLDYSAAVSNTQYVGALLGEFIESLLELSGPSGAADASQYHLIGHSLGAHISGYAGYYLNDTLGRITALDPAGPCFLADTKTAATAVEDGYLDHTGGRRRLSRQSAQWVLALHTDATLFGLKQNCAHYDVYVNGGYKQPGCGSTGPSARLEDFFNLNFKDSFNFNIACCHSYGHQLLNKFVTMQGLQKTKLASTTTTTTTTTTTRSNNGHDNIDRCYPIAYECADWKAFKAGECGFCRDGDTRCVNTGLTYSGYQPSLVLDYFEGGYAMDAQFGGNGERGVNSEADDDDEFNDEDGDNDDPDGAGNVDYTLIEQYSRGKHFMRAGPASMTCVYHYQIVIAAKKQTVSALKEPGKYYYYLHIPLELSGKLTDEQGKRLNDRLVQVSHKLQPGSTAYKYLASTYLNTLPPVPLADSRSDELEFYTALITFEPVAQADKKCQGDQTNGAGRKDKWQICSPLDNIQEARLWSSSDIKLDAVVWVGVNYMSGGDYEHRLSESYVFSRRNPGEPVRNRAEVDKASQAKLSETEPNQSNSLGNVVDSAAKTIDCLLSVFDSSDTSNAKRNFKCNRSGKELLYAIDLEPSKFDSDRTY